MTWWIGIALCVVFAITFWWFSLRLRHTDQADQSNASRIFLDQLKEVDAELEEGILSVSEAESARLEIKRRLLAENKKVHGKDRVGGAVVIVLCAALIPVGALGLYSLLGSPELASVPFAERGEERAIAAEQADRVNEVRQIAQRVEDRLTADPNGGETEKWYLLGQTYLQLENYSKAAETLSKIADRDDVTLEMRMAYAEAIIGAADGAITPNALAIIDETLRQNPNLPSAVFWKAMSEEQDGKQRDAFSRLADFVEQAIGNEPWLQTFVFQANRIAATLGEAPIDPPRLKGPTQADIQAAQEMSLEEQREFIASMVDGLAARLEDNPNDIQGWLQLARAYSVLGRDEDADQALQNAWGLAKDLPEGNLLRQAVEQAMN